MAQLVEARVTGDWRRIVGDYITNPDDLDDLDNGVTGIVKLRPEWDRGTEGVPSTDATLYTFQEIRCRVWRGRLHDANLNDPWQDIVVDVDGAGVRWRAVFDLAYTSRFGGGTHKLVLPDVVFDAGATVDGEISLTALLPAPSREGIEYLFINADASAESARLAELAAGRAEGSAEALDEVVETVGIAAWAAEDAAATAQEHAATATQARDDAIAAGLRWQGEWEYGTRYIPGDAVGYNGSSWRAVIPSTDIVPAENASWSQIASGGMLLRQIGYLEDGSPYLLDEPETIYPDPEGAGFTLPPYLDPQLLDDRYLGGSAGLAFDVDGVPFFRPGGSLQLDADGVPYF